MAIDRAVRRQFIGSIRRNSEAPESAEITVVERPLVANHRRWTTFVKLADESKTSDATYADDAELTIPLDADSRYLVQGEIFFNTSATPDFKFQITGPTSPDEVLIRGHHVEVGGVNDTDFVDTAFSTSHAVTGTGSTTGGFVKFSAVVNTGANAGSFTLQWAQNTSNVASTTVLAGSHFDFIKVIAE